MVKYSPLEKIGMGIFATMIIGGFFMIGLATYEIFTRENKTPTKIEKILIEDVCGKKIITPSSEYIRLEDGTLYEKVGERNYDF